MDEKQLLDQPGTLVIELDIQGMTCASCVSRVERKLGKLDGVAASVNLPLESAQVTVPAGVTDEQITATVAAAGYQATVRPAPARESAGMPEEESVPTSTAGANRLRPRLVLAAVLTVPVVLISMIPTFQFANWGWVAGALALPVVTWSAWPFHRAAAVNARHLASTMDTLVSIGVIAAYVFSAWQLLADPLLTAHPDMTGMAGMEARAGGLYFETAAVVSTFLLLGRYLEAHAKRTATNTRSLPGSWPWATSSWSGPAKRSRPTVSSLTAPPPSTPRS